LLDSVPEEERSDPFAPEHTAQFLNGEEWNQGDQDDHTIGKYLVSLLSGHKI